MKLLLLALMGLLSICQLHGQVVNGRAIAESGEAAGRVHVSFRNKANTVLTNDDGSFSIRATKLPDTLEFRGIGLEPYDVVVTEKTLKDPNFEVVLLNKREALQEVVVTAYGTKRKKSITGSIAKVTPSITTSSALSGKVSGVIIRGSSSIARDEEVKMFEDGIQDKKLFGIAGSKGSKDSIIYKSRLLTAGEVNDFSKWKMWEDFAEDDFKTWSSTWEMTTLKRYAVQVMNKDNRAAVNKKVELVNRISNQIIWSAITDNTGKAELWADGSTIGDENIFIRCEDQLIYNPSMFANGVNRIKLVEGCNVSNKVDIAFVVDATGSMGDEIEFLKMELEDLIRSTFNDYAHMELRVASVFYRDWLDEYLTRKIDFQSDLLKLLNFVKLQQAGGGGDEPEAVHTAMNTALDSLQWSADARTRLLFLILDAPPHEDKKAEIAEQIRKAAAKGIRIIPIVCSGAGKSTEYLMRTMALATNGTYVFLTDDSGIGLKHTKPTTDAYKVELLNGLLQRLIKQMISVNNCNETKPLEPFVVHSNIEKVKIYPNPTRGNLVIESKKTLKQVFITDFAGKILMNLSMNPKQNQWKADITQYPAGTYMVKYVTTGNEWGAEKILLMH